MDRGPDRVVLLAALCLLGAAGWVEASPRAGARLSDDTGHTADPPDVRRDGPCGDIRAEVLESDGARAWAVCPGFPGLLAGGEGKALRLVPGTEALWVRSANLGPDGRLYVVEEGGRVVAVDPAGGPSSRVEVLFDPARLPRPLREDGAIGLPWSG